jgi:signal peptidase I
MLPTLQSGDLLVIDKTAYRHSEPERGDIVVARYRDEFIVKRIIALPGEKVEMIKGRVYVNDTPLVENGQVIGGELRPLFWAKSLDRPELSVQSPSRNADATDRARMTGVSW